jgi:hypothetical protein
VRALLVVAVVPACWTGAVAEEHPSTPAPSSHRPTDTFRITLERTSCMGMCPTYRVDIDSRKRVARFIGSSNVAVEGERLVRVSRDDLAALERKVAEVRFFERSPNGSLPIEQTCTSDGTTTTCTIGTRISICSDTSHAIITVRRGSQSNTVDDSCQDDADLVDLATLIDQVARAHRWIGDE